MTDDAALSRKLLAQSRDAYEGDEEARAFLQKRLEVYARVMFWSFVTLRALEVVLYRMYKDITPSLYLWIFCTGIVGLAAMAACWRGLLVRRTLSLRALERIDFAYTVSSGVVFGATALLAADRRESAYTCLVYACFVIFMRALVVPSSGTRTAKLSALTMAPLVIAAAAISRVQEVPGPAYLTCAFIYCAAAVTIAVAGSRLIYGLRRRVRESARLGQYTLGRKISDGAMGAVYYARHALLRRPTALKLLPADRISAAALDRFERELPLISQLTHPNTALVYDYGHNPDGVFYYAMEYLDGIELDELVRHHGPQPVGRVIDILVQVCGSLHEAHLRGIVHRSISPTSIVLCERGGQKDVAKVVDFGLARESTGTPADDLRALGEVASTMLGAEAKANDLLACFAHAANAAALARSLRALRDKQLANQLVNEPAQLLQVERLL